MIGKMGLGLGLGMNRGRRNIKLYDDILNVLWVGQSNAGKIFTDFSGAGNTAFLAEIGTHYGTKNSINGATDGAAIHKDADTGNGYYWDPVLDTPGQALLDALTAVDNAAVDRHAVDAVIIAHGETDAVALDDSTVSESDVKTALLAYINYLRTELDNPLILLTPIGADSNGNEFTGWGLMRKVQYELWSEKSYILENPAYYDQPMQDDLHLTQAGYEAFGERSARRILGLLGKISKTGTLGPQAISATFSPAADKATVTIMHDGGTDFTFTEKKGHNILQNGTVLGTSSVAKVSSTSFDVLPSTGLSTGDTILPYWAWGTLKSYTPGNILIDNASNPLPLRPFFGLTATEI